MRLPITDDRDVLREDFMFAVKRSNLLKKLKKIFLEECMQEKVKLEGKGTPYHNSASMIMAYQIYLKEDTGEESNINFISYDVSPFGLGFIIETVVCKNGKCYRRMVSASEHSKFVYLEQGVK